MVVVPTCTDGCGLAVAAACRISHCVLDLDAIHASTVFPLSAVATPASSTVMLTCALVAERCQWC